MYTEAMKWAVKSLAHHAPNNFTLEIYDNNMFLTIVASEKQFMNLADGEKRHAVEYMDKVKKALEANGATVLVVREGGKDDNN